jgi:acetyl-CoA synthetase
MITPLPGVTTTTPGTAVRPFPGIAATILNHDAEEVDAGLLVITRPWPSMLRTIWGDDQRFHDTYWSMFTGMYFPGDGAKREDGNIWILGASTTC